MLGNDQDILPSLAQGRHNHLNSGKVLTEILSKPPLHHRLRQVLPRRAEDSNIDLNRFSPSDTFKFPFLKDPPQFILQARRERIHLTEQQGPLMREFEAASAAAQGTGQRPFFMAEKFRLQQMIRKIGATHFD